MCPSVFTKESALFQVKLFMLPSLFKKKKKTKKSVWGRKRKIAPADIKAYGCFLSFAANLQEKLTDFLPKLLDCSTEIKGFNDPPKLPSYSTHELCERYARIMLSLSRTPADGR